MTVHRVAAWALGLALVAAVAAADDRKAMDAYGEGVAAMEAGRPRDAITHMEAALATKPQEGQFKIGVRTFEYVPSRTIAEAWLALGDAAKARQFLERAERVKAMGKGERDAIARLRSRLDAAAAPATPPPVAAASAPATPVPAARAACPDGPAAAAALGEGDLAKARRLAAACLASGEDAAARRVMTAVEAEVSGLLTRARREKASGDVALATATLASVLAIDPANAEALDLRDAVALAGASAPRATAPAVAAATGPRAPAPVAAATAPVPPPVPAGAVEPGVRAFFEGRVAASVAALEPQAVASTRADVVTIYACALATQSLVEKDATRAGELATKARAAWTRAKTLRPGIQLDEGSFSPRVRALLGP